MRRRYSLLATAGAGVADRPPAAGSAIAVTPIARRRLARTSLQVGGDLLEAGLYAGFVLFAARSAGGAGRADHLLADFDRQRAARGGEAGKILRAHLRILLQSLFHVARGDAEGARGKGLLKAVLHGVRSGTVASDLDQHLAVAPDDGGRHAIAIRCAGGDGGLRDGQRHGGRYVLAGEQLRAGGRGQGTGKRDAAAAIRQHRHDQVLPLITLETFADGLPGKPTPFQPARMPSSRCPAGAVDVLCGRWQKKKTAGP